jgi:branched-chain amino acid transport system permease protein
MRLNKRLAQILLLIVAIALPFIFSDAYSQQSMVLICLFSILALSFDVLVGYTGQVSMAHAAFFGIGAYASTLISMHFGISVWLSGLAGILAASIAGLILGYISFIRTRDFPFSIVTFGFGLALLLVTTNTVDLTRGTSGISAIPAPVIAIPGLPGFEIGTSFTFYYLILVVLIFTIYLIQRMLKSHFGRAIVAVRENESLASSIGINTTGYLILAFGFSALLAGLAGVLYAHYIRFISPSLLSMNYIFIIIIMVIVGGRATLPGPIIGAIIYVGILELLRFMDEFRIVAFGVIFLICIVFMPRGIYPALVSLWNRVWLSLKPKERNTQKPTIE